MKSKEEIEQLAIDYAKTQVVRGKNLPEWDDKTEQLIARYFTKGYTQCQEDMLKILKEEIKRAFIHGQGNAQMMEAGLERDEIEDYIYYRMLTLNKQD